MDESDDSDRVQRSESGTSPAIKSFQRELAASTGYSDELAGLAASSVFCALEVRIFGEDLGSIETVPLKVTELLQRCPRHQHAIAVDAARQPLLEEVASELGRSTAETELMVRAVLATLRGQLSEAESDDLARHLPVDAMPFWHGLH